jgi:hypothetical protein
MLSPIMLSVILLSVIMVNVIILSPIMLCVILLIVIMVNVIMVNVIMVNVILLNVIMLNVIMLCFIILNVMAPFLCNFAGFNMKRFAEAFSDFKKITFLFILMFTMFKICNVFSSELWPTYKNGQFLLPTLNKLACCALSKLFF